MKHQFTKGIEEKEIRKIQAEMWLKECKLCMHTEFIRWCDCGCHRHQAEEIINE